VIPFNNDSLVALCYNCTLPNCPQDALYCTLHNFSIVMLLNPSTSSIIHKDLIKSKND
jgi:hypothetical protein